MLYKAFQRAENADGCAIVGDTAAIEAQVDTFIAAVIGALRFVDNGDGTVTDRQTGLMWEKKSDDGSIHDKDDTYTWSASGTDPDGTAFTTFLAALNTPPCFAGYCDWRLPAIAGLPIPTGAAELESLRVAPAPSCGVDPCVSPAFDSNCTSGCTVSGCSCTISDSYLGYWSSTAETDPARAWLLNFQDGYLATCDKKSCMHSVRAVRSGL